jgi:hypothetical protein
MHFKEVEGPDTAGDFPDVRDVFHAAISGAGTARKFVSVKVHEGGICRRTTQMAATHSMPSVGFAGVGRSMSRK